MKDLYEISEKLHKEYKNYNKVLSRYGVHLSEMANLAKEVEEGNYKIVCTSEKYHRTTSGRWQSNPYESETKEIDVEFYLNTITSIQMFNDRVSRSYTKYGYIPTKLSCVSWGDGSIKAVRTFEFGKEM